MQCNQLIYVVIQPIEVAVYTVVTPLGALPNELSHLSGSDLDTLYDLSSLLQPEHRKAC